MSIMGKKANNLSLTNLSFEIATFFLPREKTVVGPKWPKDRCTQASFNHHHHHDDIDADIGVDVRG